ncbi:MAG: HAD-IIB family hydrolase [Eubacteriales bacterium]|nr:HAD-IIB family hydrolase [Eubacteriales bacterium]MDD3503742.1 HAD-IIB family hydrolase [Eubacteriales bacterium]
MSIVFFDIDGTLIDKNHKLPGSAAKAIRKLRANGHRAYINTGRCLCTIQQSVLDIGFDGIVASCGTSIHVVEEQADLGLRTLFEKTISPLLLYSMLPVFEKQKIDLWLEGPKFLYVADPEATGFMAKIVEYLKQDKDIIRSWHDTSLLVNKFTYRTTRLEQLDPLREVLEANFDIVPHTELVGEVLLKGFNKATGVDFMLDHLKSAGEISGEEDVFAFGDSPNDLTMLGRADHAVAMGDGDNRAIEAAEYVTTAPDRDGIYLALKQYKLI